MELTEEMIPWIVITGALLFVVYNLGYLYGRLAWFKTRHDHKRSIQYLDTLRFKDGMIDESTVVSPFYRRESRKIFISRD